MLCVLLGMGRERHRPRRWRTILVVFGQEEATSLHLMGASSLPLLLFLCVVLTPPWPLPNELEMCLAPLAKRPRAHLFPSL